MIEPLDKGDIRSFGQKFIRIGVQAHGNCFFDSLSILTEIPDVRMKVLRTLVDDAGVWDRFLKFFDVRPPYCRKTMLAKLKNEKIWADEMMIAMSMFVMKMNIFFIDSTTMQFHCDFSLFNERLVGYPEAIVLWVRRNHFEPLITTKRRKIFDGELTVLYLKHCR